METNGLGSHNLSQGGRDLSNDGEERKRRTEVSGVLVPAGLLIGMGVGWLFGHLVEGLLIGLGAGLLLMAIMQLTIRR